MALNAILHSHRFQNPGALTRTRVCRSFVDVAIRWEVRPPYEQARHDSDVAGRARGRCTGERRSGSRSRGVHAGDSVSAQLCLTLTQMPQSCASPISGGGPRGMWTPQNSQRDSQFGMRCENVGVHSNTSYFFFFKEKKERIRGGRSLANGDVGLAKCTPILDTLTRQWIAVLLGFQFGESYTPLGLSNTMDHESLGFQVGESYKPLHILSSQVQCIMS
jgi:hypothetical protein